jgi:general secretion pathway protein F
MALWSYKGVDARGKAVSVTRGADSPKGLRSALRATGIVVTDVAEARGGKAPVASSAGGLRREVNLGASLRKIKRAEVAAFTRQMATLLRAGIPLAEALGALNDQLDNPKLQTIIGEVRTRVNEGTSFADALAKHPQVFEGVYVSMVRGGETAGNLDAVLMRLAEFTEAEVALRSKVIGAMVYPIIMAVVAAIVMTILMVLVVPKITSMYQDTDRVLPWNTQLAPPSTVSQHLPASMALMISWPLRHGSKRAFTEHRPE